MNVNNARGPVVVRVCNMRTGKVVEEFCAQRTPDKATLRSAFPGYIPLADAPHDIVPSPEVQ